MNVLIHSVFYFSFSSLSFQNSVLLQAQPNQCCVLRCVTAVESLVVAVVLDLAIQTAKFKTALKESYPIEPLTLKEKSEMQILFLHLHFLLLSKIISNLGLTIVFSATFVQFQPLLSIAYESSEIFMLFICDHSNFTLRIFLRDMQSVCLSQLKGRNLALHTISSLSDIYYSDGFMK